MNYTFEEYLRLDDSLYNHDPYVTKEDVQDERQSSLDCEKWANEAGRRLEEKWKELEADKQNEQCNR